MKTIMALGNKIMEFKRYSSIENSYRKRFLDKIIEEGHGGETFVVQEKCHGSNFSMYISKDQIRCAKRSGFIKENESFFNYEKVLDKYEPNLRTLFNKLNKNNDIESVVVFGELYGGNYPHKDVPNVDVKAVQKGVYYNPDQDFIAFDIKVNGLYLDVESANIQFLENNIPYTKTLFEGSLEDCLKYPNKLHCSPAF